MTGKSRSINEHILALARAELGKKTTGDPVPGWLYEAMQNAGVNMRTLPVDTRAFIDECAELGIRADYFTMQPGDVGVLQYQWDDQYWMYVVTDVSERTYKVILGRGYNPYSETEIIEQEFSKPDFEHLWHTNALLHFNIKDQE